MSPNKPVVIADKFQSYKSWCWENGVHVTNAIFVNAPHKVRGMSLKRSQIRYSDNAVANPDILEIEQAVHLACLRNEQGDLDWFNTERGRAHLAEQEARAELAQLERVKQQAERAKRLPGRDQIVNSVKSKLKLLGIHELSNLQKIMENSNILSFPESDLLRIMARERDTGTMVGAGSISGDPARRHLEDFVDGTDG